MIEEFFKKMIKKFLNDKNLFIENCNLLYFVILIELLDVYDFVKKDEEIKKEDKEKLWGAIMRLTSEVKSINNLILNGQLSEEQINERINKIDKYLELLSVLLKNLKNKNIGFEENGNNNS